MERVTILAEDAHLAGRIEGNDVTVLGSFEGDLQVTGSLRIGPVGRIKAMVRADTVEIAGQFDGDIRATNLRIMETARVSGTFRAERLLVREGAWLDGLVNLPVADETRPAPAEAEKPRPEAAGAIPVEEPKTATEAKSETSADTETIQESAPMEQSPPMETATTGDALAPEASPSTSVVPIRPIPPKNRIRE